MRSRLERASRPVQMLAAPSITKVAPCTLPEPETEAEAAGSKFPAVVTAAAAAVAGVCRQQKCQRQAAPTFASSSLWRCEDAKSKSMYFQWTRFKEGMQTHPLQRIWHIAAATTSSIARLHIPVRNWKHTSTAPSLTRACGKFPFAGSPYSQGTYVCLRALLACLIIIPDKAR